MSDKFDVALSPEDVEEIITILNKSNYETMELETPRFRLRVARAGEGWSQEWLPIGQPVQAVSSPQAMVENNEDDDGFLSIRSPLPGTFYVAPQPGAAPFVKVGDKVDVDTEVAIVETMKLMTTVSAGVAGTIVEIVHEDATPLEANAILFKVQPE